MRERPPQKKHKRCKVVQLNKLHFHCLTLKITASWNKMASFEERSDDILSSFSRHLMDEQPKIGAAAKNLIAMVLGRSMTDPSNRMLFANDVHFTPDIALVCGRALLQAIQAFEPEDPMSWSVTHPQPEQQSGEDRLNDVIRYRCLHTLRSHVKAKNGKVSTLFGRSFLVWSKSWPSIRSSIARPESVPEDLFEYFLSMFERSILLEEGAIVSDDTHGSDEALIWAQDFAGVLHKRQETRQEEAAKRRAAGSAETKREDAVSVLASALALASSSPSSSSTSDIAAAASAEATEESTGSKG
jgi:hypothetical protein